MHLVATDHVLIKIGDIEFYDIFDPFLDSLKANHSKHDDIEAQIQLNHRLATSAAITIHIEEYVL